MKDTLSPASLLVLGCTFLLVSPSLWDLAHGELSVHAALTRYLVVLVGCWFTLSLAAGLAPRSTPDGVPLVPEDSAAPPVPQLPL